MGDRGRIGLRGDETYIYDNRDLFSGTLAPRPQGSFEDNFGIKWIVESETNIRDYSGGTRRNDRNPDHPYVDPSFHFEFLPLGWQQADRRPLHFKISSRDIAKADGIRRREEHRQEMARMRTIRGATTLSSPLPNATFLGASQSGGLLHDVFNPTFRG